jgi:hypothetical protein
MFVGGCHHRIKRDVWQMGELMKDIEIIFAVYERKWYH